MNKDYLGREPASSDFGLDNILLCVNIKTDLAQGGNLK
jgi:hypothetical protein